MKDTESEIKQNIQGTNSDRKETRSQSNDLEQKEKINERYPQMKLNKIFREPTVTVRKSGLKKTICNKREK